MGNCIGDTLKNLLGISESFEMPDALLKLLLDGTRRPELLKKLSGAYDFSIDGFRDYFQSDHSKRDEFKQDFTPDCICKLISQLAPKCNRILDACSGTGALILSNIDKAAEIQCEELTSRAIPVLLCNLAIRNLEGTVRQRNVITGTVEHDYRLTAGTEFSNVEEIQAVEEKPFDVILSNPPYSLGWEPKQDKRFSGYALPPKSKADYVFVLDAINRLTGMAFFILPHGVLFRGNSEGEIRKQLVENNLIDAIIGLPDKLFLNTGIPVFVMVLNKNKADKDVLVIDGSKLFIKRPKQNDMSDEHIAEIVSACKKRETKEKLSRLVSVSEIRKNDYNLNISRYVDTFERESTPNLLQTLNELTETAEEIRETELKLIDMMKQLYGTTPEKDQELKKAIRQFERYINGDQVKQLEMMM